jgi:putative heme degradation protein
MLATTPFGPTEAFDAFVRRNTRPVSPPQPGLAPIAPARPATAPPRNRLDAALSDWSRNSGFRTFGELLNHHGLNRSQLYAAADDTTASRVKARELVVLLRWMIDQSAPMSLQVGRCGVATSVRVVADELITSAGGLELAGGNAVLRLALEHLAEVWLVQQTSLDGTPQQSIQILDTAGELAVCIGGAEQVLAAGVRGWTRQPFRPGVSP